MGGVGKSNALAKVDDFHALFLQVCCGNVYRVKAKALKTLHIS